MDATVVHKVTSPEGNDRHVGMWRETTLARAASEARIRAVAGAECAPMPRKDGSRVAWASVCPVRLL